MEKKTHIHIDKLLLDACLLWLLVNTWPSLHCNRSRVPCLRDRTHSRTYILMHVAITHSCLPSILTLSVYLLCRQFNISVDLILWMML